MWMYSECAAEQPASETDGASCSLSNRMSNAGLARQQPSYYSSSEAHILFAYMLLQRMIRLCKLPLSLARTVNASMHAFNLQPWMADLLATLTCKGGFPVYQEVESYRSIANPGPNSLLRDFTMLCVFIDSSVLADLILLHHLTRHARLCHSGPTDE